MKKGIIIKKGYGVEPEIEERLVKWLLERGYEKEDILIIDYPDPGYKLELLLIN